MDTPYIPDPFPLCPTPNARRWRGPEKRVRPYLFWAAIHLASLEQDNASSGVLVAIAQQPSGYAEDLLALLENDWQHVVVPSCFEPPGDSRKFRLWQECLDACEDYFTRNSCEYELLEKGIVLHHGKMPGILARALIELINERVVHLVLATSTLSEGVNLPFSTILIPVLHRGTYPINVGEFRNLVGRAGRPGYGTEGRTLVVMSNQNEYGPSRVRTRYNQLISEISDNNDGQAATPQSAARSALASLLSQIERLWRRVTQSASDYEFIAWLEQIAPTQIDNASSTTPENMELVGSVDTLDGILLSSIVEQEQLSEQQLDSTVLEDALQRIWRRTYARVALNELTTLQNLFIRRGLALHARIYPDRTHRRRLYKTSLPPRSATQLLSIYPDLLPHLRSGTDYLRWSNEDKFEFVRRIVGDLATVQQFHIDAQVRREGVTWSDVLKWWLDPQHASILPRRNQFSNWHKFIADNFQYRFNWGLGSLVALAMDDAYQGALHLPRLEEWPQTGLPWIVFWLKELVIWGTLDPVAALLLSRRRWRTRQEAEGVAREYYQSRIDRYVAPDAVLEPMAINRWVLEAYGSLPREERLQTWPYQIPVVLLRDFSNTDDRRFRVLPVKKEDRLYWYDPAGFPLATSTVFENWERNLAHQCDFHLDPQARVVTSQLYL